MGHRRSTTGGRPFLFNQVTIIGLGLIGGSLGMALKRGRLARTVYGIDRDPRTVREAKAKGAVDQGSIQWSAGLKEAGLVVIATFPSCVADVAQEVAQSTRHSFILTDVASTKEEIVRQLDRLLPDRISFVGGHPMAGSERSGIGAATGTLFHSAPCIVTPTSRTAPRALSRVRALWGRVGGRVVSLAPSVHDTLVAQVSHVPHLVAAALVLAADPKALRISGGGFADATRVALSDPRLWEQVCRTNRDEIVKSLDRFLKELKISRGFLVREQSEFLRRRFERARQRRSPVHR